MYTEQFCKHTFNYVFSMLSGGKNRGFQKKYLSGGSDFR